MFLNRGSRALRRHWGTASTILNSPRTPRWFSESRRLLAVKPVVLADIGEGIVECEVIQWFVEPGARVEEFSPLCEVQSDKASVDITSRFSGIVKKLYYEAGEMAKVGKPFVDIDTQTDESETPSSPPPWPQAPAADAKVVGAEAPAAKPNGKGKAAALATPAVRHLSKELGVDILEIDGSGKDGRVLKEDIYKFVQSAKPSPDQPTPAPSPSPTAGGKEQTETRVALTNTQHQMFKTMTRSLSIPHFLYADEVDLTNLVSLRARLNKVLASDALSPVAKLTYLPFIIKAVSMALYQFPILNARVDVDGSSKPSLVMRFQHNIGVAMDTPQGLLVPVIKDVGGLNILSIAGELARLQALAAQGKLSPADLAGGTVTVSNIGNIGGTYLSPVIVEREVAILGVGRMRTVPAFASSDGNDDELELVKKHVCNFSWSADHRVVDGATMARAAEVVRRVVEEPDVMVMHLR